MKHRATRKSFLTLTDGIPLSKDGKILAGSHRKMTHLGGTDTKLSVA